MKILSRVFVALACLIPAVLYGQSITGDKTFDKGPSTFDVPHRFVYSYIYDLPFGRGKRFGGGMDPVLNSVLGGWQFSGITTFSMGQFQTPGLGVDWLNAGAFTSSRPNIIGDVSANRSLPNAYVNPAAFDFPRDAAGNRIHVEGNASRNSIEQPGINNWDLGVFKNFRVTERFNTQFGPANLSVTSANFGKITGDLIGPRRMQFGLRLTY